MLSSLQGLFGKSDSSVAQPISASVAPSNNKGEISVRTPDEIDGLEKAIKVGPVIFVFVHADWCGHCQTYKPIWKELETAPGRQANMAMIHHDMVEKSPTLKNAKIPGYPTVLKVYPNGRIEDYDEKGSKTNAVPNIRDKVNMMKQISSAMIPGAAAAAMMNAGPQPKLNNSRRVNNNSNRVNNNSGKANNSRANSVRTANLNKLINSLKANGIRVNTRNTLKANIHPASLVARRNIANEAKVHASDQVVLAGNNGITVGATPPPRLPVPPMTGGSLYAMLRHSLLRAGPAVGLLAASQYLPPKKNRGSTLRLTRRSNATRRNKSKHSKSRKN